MDPNVTLDTIRQLARCIAMEATEVERYSPDDALALALTVEALDAWLCKGGFAPSDWCRHGNPCKEG